MFGAQSAHAHNVVFVIAVKIIYMVKTVDGASDASNEAPRLPLTVSSIAAFHSKCVTVMPFPQVSFHYRFALLGDFF